MRKSTSSSVVEPLLAGTVLIASLQPLLSPGCNAALPAWLPAAVTSLALFSLLLWRRRARPDAGPEPHVVAPPPPALASEPPALALAGLDRQQQRLQSSFEHTPLAMAWVAPDGRVEQANLRWHQWLGGAPSEVSLSSLLSPEDGPRLAAAVAAMLSGSRNQVELAVRYRTRTGDWGRGQLALALVRDGADYLLASLHPEHARAASLALPAVAHRFGGVLDHLSNHLALWIFDAASGDVLYVSEGYSTLWQRSAGSLYRDAGSYMALVHPDDRAALEIAQREQQAASCDFRLCLDDGGQRHVRLEVHQIRDEPSGTCFGVCMAFDVTDFAGRERQLKHALEHLAKTNIRLLRTSRKDALTGVYNRQYMDEALSQAFREFKRYRTALTLVFIDLAKFKQVNDNFGHGVGDSLLKAVAKRLKASVRESDMVARYGGDEFVLLLQHADEAAAWMVVNKLHKRPIEVLIDGAAPVVAQFDVGVAELSVRHTCVSDWLEDVDRSMYASKRRQRLPLGRDEAFAG